MRRSLPWLLGLPCLFALTAWMVTAHAAEPTVKTVALPPELERVPQDAPFFAHVRVGDLLKSKIVADVRKKMAPQFLIAETAFSTMTGSKLEEIESVSFYWPQLKQPPDTEEFVVIVTMSTPYDREKIKKALPKLDPPKNPEFIAISPQHVIHFTTPKTLAIMTKGQGDAYLKPTKNAGPQLDALKAAASKDATAMLGLNFATFPDEIRTNVPEQIRPIVPLFESKLVRVQAKVGSDIDVFAQADGGNAALAADIEDAMKALFNLFDEGVKDGTKELTRNDEEGNAAYIKLLKEIQTMYKAVKVKREGTSVVATMKFSGTYSFADLGTTIFRDSTGVGGNDRIKSQNNLRQIVLAMHNYYSANNGFPPAAVCDKKGKPMLSWRVLILPYVEQDALYKQFKLDEPWDSDNNKKLIEKMPKVYMQPGFHKEGEFKTHYRLFVGGGAAFDYIKGPKFEAITDGTSSTIMVVEAADGVIWTKPEELEYDANKPVPKLGYFYNKRAHIGIMDGSVRTVTDKLDEKTLRLLITPDDGQPVPEF